MGRAGCELQWRGGCVAVLLTVGALLAGCSSDPASPASPASSSWFPSLSGSFPGFTSTPAPTQAAVRGGVTPKTITTKFRRFPVAVAPGATNVVFTDIEEDLSFPIPSPAELEAYVVYVGFDDFGDRDERRPPAAKKAAPRAK